MGTPGKRVWVQIHRRFESCPLRHLNWLIQQGAKLTTCADDIVEDLNIDSRLNQTVDPPTIDQSFGQNSAGFSENALDNLARENNVLSIERRVIDLLKNRMARFTSTTLQERLVNPPRRLARFSSCWN